MEQTTALLVTGGEAPSRRYMEARLPGFSFVCAADSGFDTLAAWGRIPDLAIGDMDSIADPEILASCPMVVRLPADKDDTDTEAGLRVLRDRGYSRVVLAGGGGGRLDHLLAVRALLDRPSGPDEWLTASEQVLRLDEPTTLQVRTGDTVSVFPLSGGASGMSSKGLKWPLDGLAWNQGQFGISNVATAHTVHIDPGHRPVMVILRLPPDVQEPV